MLHNNHVMSADATTREMKLRQAPLKIDLTNVMVKSNLDLISNEHLSRFIINEGRDNALTFAMKCKNFKVFKQLLNKGVSPLCSNQDGMTAIHYAIELDRFEYLSYLFEGEQPQPNKDEEGSPKVNTTQTEEIGSNFKTCNRSTSQEREVQDEVYLHRISGV
jgi:ankyrin repeat protein